MTFLANTVFMSMHWNFIGQSKMDIWDVIDKNASTAFMLSPIRFLPHHEGSGWEEKANYVKMKVSGIQNTFGQSQFGMIYWQTV